MIKKELLERLIIAFIESELVQFTIQFVNDLMNIIYFNI